MIHSFPKIFALGENYIRDIFNEPVEITEKIDGSQFVFGKVNGELHMRSKGATLYADNPEKMFSIAISYVASISETLPDNTVFYCEYLRSAKHNILAYDRVPKNNLILFAVIKEGDFVKQHSILEDYAKVVLDIECVPLIFSGKFNHHDICTQIDKTSVLGAQKMEGIVVKNYARPFLLGGQPIPLMAGKYVTETFKEKHKSDWKSGNAGIGKWEMFKMSYRTEARWHKSIQHLRENGVLTHSPKDIGNLIKEIHRDITEEEVENIKEFLWHEFGNELLRFSTSGFPEFYKKYLIDETYTEVVKP